MKLNIQFILLSILVSFTLQKCQDLSKVRSKFVQEQYNSELLAGKWYEHQYKDLAQLGSSCQTIENTFDAQNQVMDQTFAFKYGPVPASMVLRYEHTNTKALFNRHIKLSPVPLFPSVIVDVITDSQGNYIGYADYLCLDALIEYEEIRFNTRDPVADADLIEKLKNNTRALGIKFDDKDLTVVDHSQC